MVAVLGCGEGQRGGIVSHGIGTDSEVGHLRTVLVHRPGLELRRVTPRTRSRLAFDGLPWLTRAQQEHDALTDVLRDHGTEVLYVTELLQDVLEYACAREEAIGSVLAAADLGEELGPQVAGHLRSLPPEDLAAALVAGLTPGEIESGRGLVYDLLGPHDFVVEPLPNLVFSRDSSIWIGDQAVVASLPGPRHRETDLIAVVYRHHPRFAGSTHCHLTAGSRLDGGDVVLLAPGVVAIGVGVRTTPASAELLARHLLGTGVAHTVLALPMNQAAQGSHLDRVCTVVGHAIVLMVPALAFTLTALTITASGDGLRVSRPRPFLEAAAGAIGVDRLTVIDTGLDSLAGLSGPWDDGANTLAVGQGVTVCSERNVETNARLAAAGFEVITVPAGELGGMRGGPRCMCSPISRDAPATPGAGQVPDEPPLAADPPRGEPAVIGGSRQPEPASQPDGEPNRLGELAPTR